MGGRWASRAGPQLRRHGAVVFEAQDDAVEEVRRRAAEALRCRRAAVAVDDVAADRFEVPKVRVKG